MPVDQALADRGPERTAPRSRTRPGRFGSLADWLAYTPLISTTILAKLVMPGLPPDFALAWPLIFAAVVIGLASGRMRLDGPRLTFFLVAITVMGMSQMLRGIDYSLPSFLLMMAVYFTYVVSVPRAGRGIDDALDLFSRLALAIAIAGIAQFALQFVIGAQFAYPIENLLPRDVLISGYNNMPVLSYGSTIHKANGVFLLEPSFFSQLLAIAVIVELVTRNRWPWLATYAAGLMVSYSGTGLMILAVVMPVLIVKRARWNFLWLAAGVALVAILFAKPLNLDLFLERATEFGNTRSSGFERFVGPFYVFEKFLWIDPMRGAFGLGAGTYRAFAARADFPAAEMALHKIFFEFGLIGGLLNLGFLVYCVNRSQAPIELRLGVIVMFFMSGIYTSAAHGLSLSLLIWPGRAERGGERAPPRAGAPRVPKATTEPRWSSG